MNRVSVRGFGMAAAIVAAGSLAAGATASAAQTTTAQPSAPQAGVSIADVELMAATLPASRELRLVRDARFDGVLLVKQQQARALALRAAPKVAAARAAAAKVAAAKAKRAAAAQRATRTVVRPIAPGSARAIGAQMVAARGWSTAQFVCLDNIWTRESNWRVHAYNPNGGAYGIPQAQPGSKLASAGSDWRDNAATQIRWGLSYIAGRYGTPCSAWAFWQDHHWY